MMTSVFNVDDLKLILSHGWMFASQGFILLFNNSDQLELESILVAALIYFLQQLFGFCCDRFLC
jgi:hypothetical protein